MAVSALFIIWASVSLYFTIAVIGAFWGASANQIDDRDSSKEITIYLLTSYLHADIAVPMLPDVERRFGFLAGTGFPLDNPNLRYLAFGWGSKAFYTTAGSYADITFTAAAKAITGDEAVMHIAPAGALSPSTSRIAMRLTQQQFTALLDGIERSFTKGPNGAPILLAGESHGYGDVFYEGEGHFNILWPCNIWAATILRQSGIKLGAWTPTTHALTLSYVFWSAAD